MDEGGAGVGGGERADEEGVHGYGVGGAIADGVVRFEGEVVEVEFSFLAGGEDGDDSGERTRGVGGAGGEEGEEIGGEAGAGVVVEGEFLIQAFGGFVAAFHGEDAGAQEEEVDLRLLGFEVGADGVDVAEEGDVAFDEGDFAVGVDLAELVDDAARLGFVAADEVDARGEGVADEFAGGGFADAVRAADWRVERLSAGVYSRCAAEGRKNGDTDRTLLPIRAQAP